MNTLPETGFASLKPKKDAALIMMSFIVSDIITLSKFSIMQLIAGVAEFTSGTMIQAEIAIMLSKLFNAVMDDTNIGIGHNIEFNVTRNDVVMLRQWLEQRMRHCELEREQENQTYTEWINTNSNSIHMDKEQPIRNFNPDTYIGMKLLLIELREWLLGEEVIDEKLQKLNHIYNIIIDYTDHVNLKAPNMDQEL